MVPSAIEADVMSEEVSEYAPACGCYIEVYVCRSHRRAAVVQLTEMSGQLTFEGLGVILDNEVSVGALDGDGDTAISERPRSEVLLPREGG